jgi:hypothetical protein
MRVGYLTGRQTKHNLKRIQKKHFPIGLCYDRIGQLKARNIKEFYTSEQLKFRLSE